jgi:hypothetical protein
MDENVALPICTPGAQHMFTIVPARFAHLFENKHIGIQRVYQRSIKYYAVVFDGYNAKGMPRKIYLHRYIAYLAGLLDAPKNEGKKGPGLLLVDHKKGDGLDNSLVNLRVTSSKGNGRRGNGEVEDATLLEEGLGYRLRLPDYCFSQHIEDEEDAKYKQLENSQWYARKCGEEWAPEYDVHITERSQFFVR